MNHSLSSPSAIRSSVLQRIFSIALLLVLFIAGAAAHAQQTLGGINGQVTDTTGAALPDSTVTVKADGTGLTRSMKANAAGEYSFVNLPLGTYTITVTHDGFDTARFPSILVQGDRTATVNAPLKPGAVGTTIEVSAEPLLNTVDTTNGYVMDKEQIETIPLPTGSFTGLAIASPGVNAELSGGTGANSGLGNAPIWSNGQRDTSNAFLINGVDASNLFNGKSTSQVQSFRIVNNTGQSNNAGGGVIPSMASVYLAIGNAIPTPAPETIAEVRVNASMYDAQQGSSSGAHIDMSTKSGTNDWHGSVYGHRGTNWINAAPFFFKKDDNIPQADKNPQLHRWLAGGEFGGPIIKDKLFGYVGYQHLHVADQETGDELLVVPPGLTDDRSAGTLANIVNNNWTVNEGISGYGASASGFTGNNGVGYNLFNYPAAPGEPGHYLIPDQNAPGMPNLFSPYNAFLPGTSTFSADQAVADLDWNLSPKDVLSAKYFYQHDPSSSPYAYSNVPGFPEHMDTGSQVGSITNTQTLSPNFNITETIGILREKAYSYLTEEFGASAVGMQSNTHGFSNYFPGVTINDAIGDAYDDPSGPLYGLTPPSLAIGPNAASQGAFTGVFQNRIMPSANAIWTLGKHTLTFGGSWEYTQLNVRDLRTNKGIVTTPDMVAFANSWVTPYTTQNFDATTYLAGNANRYYRANQTGLYLQDKFQVRHNLSITAGLRYDWDGGFREKYGNLFNFDPSKYAYSVGTDTITSSGFVIAANNKYGTAGASNTTLTGRQWGMAPRLGFAWEPGFSHDKIVVRGGTGMYFDRGELFTYLSPGYAAGEISGGPNGVQQTLPFVAQTQCPYSASYNNPNPTYLYLYYIPICGGNGNTFTVDNSVYNLSTPWGLNAPTVPANATAANLNTLLPNAGAIVQGTSPYTLGVYNAANKLPYSINFTLNIQYQPSKTVMIELGYVGNLGRHQVIPLPFNQARIATTSSPTLSGGPYAQYFSYGYTVLDPNTFYPICTNDPTETNCSYGTMLNNYEGGNIDLRVPYVGFSSESESYTAAGVSDYNALQAHVYKRLGHGFQGGVSYTFSHTNDEQSGMGLFYNGSNPAYLRGGYGLADFDRKHVFDFNYSYTVPDFFRESTIAGKIADKWSLNGIAILQSGQPFSVIDYSGAVGSIYYSTFNGITNPIVPLANGCTPKSATTGQSGGFYNIGTGAGTALKASCFGMSIVNPGTDGVPVGDTYENNFTTGERNIFRQSWQKRADISLVKMVPIHEAMNLRYTFDVFNLTNTTSFDIPQNNVNQNQGFNNEPVYGDALYNPPAGLGIVKHTIGAARQIQMSLKLQF